MKKDTIIPEELLTKDRLLDMFREDISQASGNLRFVRLICLGMIGVICIIPIIVFCTSGINWNNIFVFILSFVAFGIIGFLVYKMPTKLIAQGASQALKAVNDGNFRLLSDVIAEKKEYLVRDKHGRIVDHNYYVKCIYHTKGRPYRRMCKSWWMLVERGDPVYLLEVLNDDGIYIPYEVFPSKCFMLDSELEQYLDVVQSINSTVENN